MGKLIPKELCEKIVMALQGNRKISFLVGAGLSAESGIPTFRGEEGFWTSGSKNYTPQEIGTKKMFDVNSNEVWRWFLYRISICRKAKPNQGHILLSKIENLLSNRFELISQNVDGLHFKPESLVKNVSLIHGDLRFMRCGDECSRELFPIPEELLKKERDRNTPITFEETELLKCPKCGTTSRPHVLWFDEYYNEYHYHLHKVMKVAKDTGLLFIIGTSGATTLPQRIVQNTFSRQGTVIDINPNNNLFTKKIKKNKNGFWIQHGSSKVLQELFDLIQRNI